MRNTTHVLYEMPSLDEFTALLKTGSVSIRQPDMNFDDVQDLSDSVSLNLDKDGIPFFDEDVFPF